MLLVRDPQLRSRVAAAEHVIAPVVALPTGGLEAPDRPLLPADDAQLLSPAPAGGLGAPGSVPAPVAVEIDGGRGAPPIGASACLRVQTSSPTTSSCRTPAAGAGTLPAPPAGDRRGWSLPTLADLGHDLLETSVRRRILVLARPGLCLAAYAAFAARGEWILAAIAVAALFVAIVAAAHDLVHRSLGLPGWANEILLSLVAMLVLESGHAYKVSHLHHHRRFPRDDDPEGDPARMSFWRAVLEGPIFLPRLWIWAFRRAPRERGWLLLEAGWFVTFAGVSVLWWPGAPGLLTFTALVIVGSWAYPVATVHWQHDVHGRSYLFQTYTRRGRIIPALFLELTFHLEHHLYPAVPSHRYAALADRLEPYLRSAGVEPRRTW